MKTSRNVHQRSPAFRLAAAFALVLACGSMPTAAQQMSLKDRLEMCSACHGADGNSKMEKFPSLAGQPEFFLMNQLILMKEGVRKIEQMEEAVKGLKDEDVIAIAQHFSKLPAKPSDEKTDPELVKRGEGLARTLRCASCHKPSMEGQEQMPRLAKQRVDYLIHSMQQFRDNKRSGADTAMTAVIVGVNDKDLEALAHFVASR